MNDEFIQYTDSYVDVSIGIAQWQAPDGRCIVGKYFKVSGEGSSLYPPKPLRSLPSIYLTRVHRPFRINRNVVYPVEVARLSSWPSERADFFACGALYDAHFVVGAIRNQEVALRSVF